MMEPTSDLNVFTMTCLLILVVGAITGIVADFNNNKAKKK